VDSVIFVTLLATNVVQWHAGLANNASTIVESVQQWNFEVSLGILGRMASAITDNRRAPHKGHRFDWRHTRLGRERVHHRLVAHFYAHLDRSTVCLLRGVTESVMLYAELWTEGNPSGYSDLV